jgi:cell wall-associated NlpC family hydrolase
MFTGRLTTGAAQLPAPSQAVRLETSTGGQWKAVANALANADGSVTFVVKPASSARYRLAYAGVMALAPSVSTEQAITVRVPVRSSSSSSGSGRAPASVAVIGSHGVAASATALAFVAAAKAQSGKPYVFGAAGPDAFDCSGLVKYVAAEFGLSLPHFADTQKGYGTAVSAADAAPGDLIFFVDSSGYAYHVGIYAGGSTMIDAPNPRTSVGLHTIWTSNVVFRRIF